MRCKIALGIDRLQIADKAKRGNHLQGVIGTTRRLVEPGYALATVTPTKGNR